MLKIYIGNINKSNKRYCEFNDAWFDKYIDKIKIDDTIIKIIKMIDNVTYAGNKRIKSKFESGVAISMKELSTGCKTAINVVAFKDNIFSAAECGDNALQVIFNFKRGNIYIPSFVIPRPFKNNIEVNVNGKTIQITNNEQLENVLNNYFSRRGAYEIYV